MEDGSREIRVSLETVLKRSWPLLAIGAVLVCAIIGGLVWFAVSGIGRKTSGAPMIVSTADGSTSTAMVGDLVSRSLDGVLVSPADANLQPYAVMVENHTDARPLSGPAAANLAYEIPVEGGITRYLLVFDATTTVDQIGPVRSARPYFVDMADGLNAVYAHVGGSPDALNNIKGMSSFRDLNEFFNGKYFWRSAKRDAPHNAYTRTDLLHAAAAAKSWREGHFHGWSYKEDYPLDATPTSTVARGTIQGPDLQFGGAYNVSWTYDRTSNAYLRSEGGSKQTDANGAQVTARNVVVIQTDGKTIDDYGRLSIRTTGRGKATLYRDGYAIPVTWKRTSGEHLLFESADGSDTFFNRGTTWVEVTFDGAMYGGASAAASATSTR